MAAFTVIWAKSWQGRPIRQPAECRHGGEDALTINQRLEPRSRGRGSQIAVDGSVCMACGADSTGNFTLAEGLRLCMDQHGWNREAGLRLHDLAAFHKAELMGAPAIPIWCFHAFGWTGKQIVDALNAERLLPTRMSDSVEQLAAELRP
jgi:hypothetical protein